MDLNQRLSFMCMEVAGPCDIYAFDSSGSRLALPRIAPSAENGKVHERASWLPADPFLCKRTDTASTGIPTMTHLTLLVR